MGRHEVEIVASRRVYRELEEQSGGEAVEIKAPPSLVFQFHMTRLHRSSVQLLQASASISQIEGPKLPDFPILPELRSRARHELSYLGKWHRAGSLPRSLDFK